MSLTERIEVGNVSSHIVVCRYRPPRIRTEAPPEPSPSPPNPTSKTATHLCVCDDQSSWRRYQGHQRSAEQHLNNRRVPIPVLVYLTERIAAIYPVAALCANGQTGVVLVEGDKVHRMIQRAHRAGGVSRFKSGWRVRGGRMETGERFRARFGTRSA